MSAPVNREKVESARTYLEDFARLSKPGEIRLPREDAADAFGHVRTLLADHAAQAEEIERLNERLENNHMFDAQGGRVDVEPGSIPDGIECRDETIKLQDERITAQAETIKSLTEALMSLSSAMADMLHADVNPNLVTIRRHRLSGWVQRADTALSKALPNTGEKSQ